MSTSALIQDHMLLVSRFLRNPRSVGALAPSSRALAEAMTDHLQAVGPSSLVELGPGTGALTSVMLERMPRDSRLLAVEIDPVFAEALRRRWPSLDVACAAAEQLPELLAARGQQSVDHVISGLPFITLPAPVVERTLAALATSLRPGGTFTTFQYVHSYGWPSGVNFRRRMAEVLSAAPPLTRVVVPNAPPAVVLRWQKG